MRWHFLQLHNIRRICKGIFGYIRRICRGTFGYIRRIFRGTFGYIRVHSGTFGHVAPPENTRVLLCPGVHSVQPPIPFIILKGKKLVNVCVQGPSLPLGVEFYRPTLPFPSCTILLSCPLLATPSGAPFAAEFACSFVWPHLALARS